MNGALATRAPLLLLGFASLIAGVAGGLARQGFALPWEPGDTLAYHGPLMVGGFFGTVIALERAVALGKAWAYAAPLAAGAGALALPLGRPVAGAGLLLAASVALALATTLIWARHRALFTGTLALGALCWAIGNLAWLAGAPVARAVPWWIGFFVLTICGERLELTRLLPPRPAARTLFVATLAVLLAGMAAGLAAPRAGAMVLCAGLALAALWLLWFDIVRRTVLSTGLPRYVAVNLIAGYVWLLAGAGAIALDGGFSGAGPIYDAALHSILIGFVFSMVFGHAPIIFPAILRVPIPYTPWSYAATALLQASMLARAAGDLAASEPARALGAAGNASAIAVFILVTAASAVLAARGSRSRARRG